MRWAPLLLLAMLVARPAGPAHAESAPLLEEPDTDRAWWTLSLLGGGVLPTGAFADEHELGLVARATLSFNLKNGLGAAISASYSPLPAVVSDENVRRDNHVGSATLAPRYTLGRGALRLFLGGGGGVVYERSKQSTVDGAEPSKTSSATEAAAMAEAGLELHFGDTGGLTLGGTYTYGVGDLKAQMAAAQAGFVLAF